MIHDDQFHESVRSWLDATAPPSAPDRILDATTMRIRDVRQASGSRFPTPAMAVAAALLLLVAAVAAVGISRIGSPEPRPSDDLRPLSVQCPASPCAFVLAEGREYTSTSVAPPVAFSVPTDRWVVAEDLPRYFRIEITADERRAIAIIVDPQPTRADGRPDRLAPTDDVRALAQWLSSRDQLVVSNPEPAVLGGLSGFVVELRGDPDSTTIADGCLHDGFCAGVFSYAGVAGERRAFSTGASDTIRLYLLEAGDAVVAVSVEARHGAPADFLDSEALEVLGTVRLDSP